MWRATSARRRASTFRLLDPGRRDRGRLRPRPARVAILGSRTPTCGWRSISRQRAAVAVDLSRRVQRDSLRRVIEGQEIERRRLARELHDETGQALTSVLLGLKTVENADDKPRGAVAELRELVVATLQNVRRLAVELRPKALDDFGLVPRARAAGRDLRGGDGHPRRLRVTARRGAFAVRGRDHPVPDRAGVVDQHRQARGRAARQRSARPAGRVCTALVEDDGHGFDAEDELRGGIGLSGMRERIALLDGRLTVESTRGSGTSLVAEVPLS